MILRDSRIVTRLAMAVWISKFLGPVILALSIPMIVTPRRLQETTRRFLADSPLVLIQQVNHRLRR